MSGEIKTRRPEIDHARFMQAAYQEALKAIDEGEVPVGAVVQKDGAIIGRGYNRIERLADATAHAEIIAITAAANGLGTWRLDGCTIYVTLEPCIMCLGALLQARISAIAYGAADLRLGAIDSHSYAAQLEKAYGFFPEITPGIMVQECSSLLSSFFKQVREKKKKN